MSQATMWWLLAGLLVAAELTSGTFYLLMLAVGAVVGAGLAMVGAELSTQIGVASVVAVATTAVWHWRRAHHPQSAPAAENRDVNLDIGQRVQVDHWAPDRTARVNYRGTLWTAKLAPADAPAAGSCRIVAVEGNWLVLSPLESGISPPATTR